MPPTAGSRCLDWEDEVKRLLLTAAALALASTVSAVPYNEIGDAGQTLATAQGTGTASPLTQILGSVVTSSADIFALYLTGGAFSAETSSNFDAQLFLFDATGLGVLGNDDGGPGLQARIASAALAAGTYYIAVSAYNFDPVSAGGLIFPSSPFDPIYGPTGPGGGSPLSGWMGTGGSGTYTIDLEGAVGSAVPEPGTLLLLGSGISALVVRRRRRA
jgi:hypothetical protein